jgi:hypothetical protein
VTTIVVIKKFANYGGRKVENFIMEFMSNICVNCKNNIIIVAI